jgi:hypothetical protein
VLVLIFAFFLLPETKYERPLAAYQGQVAAVSTFAASDGDRGRQETYTVRRVSTLDVVELDFVNYKPRTLASDMRLFVYKPDWEEDLRTLKNIFAVIFFPDILWAFVSLGYCSILSPLRS